MKTQWHVIAPAVHRVFDYTQMLGNIDCGNPMFSSHDVGAQVAVSKSSKIVTNLRDWLKISTATAATATIIGTKVDGLILWNLRMDDLRGLGGKTGYCGRLVRLL